MQAPQRPDAARINLSARDLSNVLVRSIETGAATGRDFNQVVVSSSSALGSGRSARAATVRDLRSTGPGIARATSRPRWRASRTRSARSPRGRTPPALARHLATAADNADRLRRKPSTRAPTSPGIGDLVTALTGVDASFGDVMDAIGSAATRGRDRRRGAFAEMTTAIRQTVEIFQAVGRGDFCRGSTPLAAAVDGAAARAGRPDQRRPGASQRPTSRARELWGDDHLRRRPRTTSTRAAVASASSRTTRASSGAGAAVRVSGRDRGAGGRPASHHRGGDGDREGAARRAGGAASTSSATRPKTTSASSSRGCVGSPARQEASEKAKEAARPAGCQPAARRRGGRAPRTPIAQAYNNAFQQAIEGRCPSKAGAAIEATKSLLKSFGQELIAKGIGKILEGIAEIPEPGLRRRRSAAEPRWSRSGSGLARRVGDPVGPVGVAPSSLARSPAATRRAAAERHGHHAERGRDGPAPRRSSRAGSGSRSGIAFSGPRWRQRRAMALYVEAAFDLADLGDYEPRRRRDGRRRCHVHRDGRGDDRHFLRTDGAAAIGDLVGRGRGHRRLPRASDAAQRGHRRRRLHGELLDDDRAGHRSRTTAAEG